MLLLVSASTSPPPPRWVINNVMRWLPIVETYIEEYPFVTKEVALAVIAQESLGIPNVHETELAYADGHNSIGLMQIVPFSWRPSSKWLSVPENNIYWGMRILNQVIQESGLRTGLARYNCGLVKLEQNKCGVAGGYAYADRVLNYWVPVFEFELTMREEIDVIWLLKRIQLWTKRYQMGLE